MKDVMAMDDQRAFIIEWPPTISQDECDDILAWVELFKRKIPRFVKPQIPTATTT
jgi:hypothetical protein